MGAAESKLAFKKGVFRLFEERNIPSDANDYWEQFWTLPESADDVFLLVGRLFSLCDSPHFLTPEAPATQLLNCDSKETLQGHRLIKTLLDLLFTSGFTLPTALESKNRVSYVIWETGIGSSKPIGTSKELDDNRTEILRLLLVLFSRSMYIPPTAITTTENRWINIVVTGSDRQITLAILCSLINSALKYNPSGWGLPYNHVMFNDQRELLVMLCLQVIVVLLDYQVIEKAPTLSSCSATGIDIESGSDDIHDQGSSSASSSTAIASNSIITMQQTQRTLESTQKNQFRFYLSRLHREQDFLFLTDGMYRILSNPMAASSTYLPGSTKQVKCHIETLMLCWKTLEVNKRFRVYLLETNRVLDFVVILLYFSLEHKLDPIHTTSDLNNKEDSAITLPSVDFHTFECVAICSKYLAISLKSTPTTDNLFCFAIVPAGGGIQPQAVGDLVGHNNPHLVYALIQYEPKIQTMARFTLQRGLDDIHKLRYRKDDTSSATRSPASTEGYTTKPAEGRQRQSRGSQSQQSSYGESTPPPSQPVSRRPQLPRRESSTIEETSTSSGPISSSGTVAMASIGTISPSMTTAALPDLNNLPAPMSPVMPPLFRPDSSDSIMAPPSDGGGHEGDVEDEGGPSTVLKSPKERSINSLSERARGKLPEKSHLYYQHSSSPTSPREESNCEIGRQDARIVKGKHSSSTLKSAGGSTTAANITSSRRPTLTSYTSSSSRHERPTTVFDVGQNGFVPTDDWVQDWMRTLRFEPLLIMLQCVIPEIESIQAMNEQQVLEYIRTNIIPMLQQVLPESGRPPIFTRKFAWTGSGNSEGDEDLALVWWFQGLLWSQIYVGGCGRLGRQGLGAWHETGVRLFSIRTITSSANPTAVMAVTENMSTVAAAAIRAAGSTFATNSHGSGSSSPDTRSFVTAASGTEPASASSRRAYGQSSSSSSRGSSSTSAPPTGSRLPTVVSEKPSI
ncbi:hypothetical protein EC991_004516 [Linnemannia zychae]|nr:hypothetical protein EC991_004516 [Linnemannia zychae]